MKILDEIITKVRNLNQDQQKDILDILNHWQTGKQREYSRLKTRADVDVVVGDRVIQTDSGDISAGGIYINTTGNFEINKSARVLFSVPGFERPFKLKGVIVRVEKNGVAIRFKDITPYFKKFLDETIWKSRNSDEDVS